MVSSSFLYIGITFAILSFSGKIPVCRACLIINVIGANKVSFMYFICVIDIPSDPHVVFDCKVSIILLMVSSSTSSKVNTFIFSIFKYEIGSLPISAYMSLARLGPIFAK